jgi:hypothetical protein
MSEDGTCRISPELIEVQHKVAGDAEDLPRLARMQLIKKEFGAIARFSLPPEALQFAGRMLCLSAAPLPTLCRF